MTANVKTPNRATKTPPIKTNPSGITYLQIGFSRPEPSKRFSAMRVGICKAGARDVGPYRRSPIRQSFVSYNSRELIAAVSTGGEFHEHYATRPSPAALHPINPPPDEQTFHF